VYPACSSSPTAACKLRKQVSHTLVAASSTLTRAAPAAALLLLCVAVQDGEAGDEAGEGEGVDILQEGEGTSQGEGQARTGSQRITTRYLTKFERARVLGTRALQIR
jgi:hypothetical protein